MHRVLFQCGPLTFYTYGAMLVGAFLTATWLAARAARQWPMGSPPLAPGDVTEWASFTMLGGLLGGRALYVLLNWDAFARTPLDIFALWHGGLVWYGGFLGGLLATWGFVRSKRVALLRALDQIIPFVALGHGIGRIGCFFNGCCYGKLRLIPTQLVEAGALFLLFALLHRWQRPSVLHHPGRLFGMYLVGYGLVRFGLECLRADQPLVWGSLTIPQLMSLPAILIGLWLAVRSKHAS